MSADFKGRREDFRLVTGQGRYTSDWDLPKQAHGYFLRSDRPHAKIKSIDTSDAASAPGVLAVLTAKETGSIAPLPQMIQIPGRDGKKIIETGRDVLAGDRVRFVGQGIAFVVAESLSQAMDAAELIQIDFEDLPFVIDREEALKDGAPQLYDHVPNNCVYNFQYGQEDAADAAFAKADHVTKIALDAPRIVGNPMEPKACLASYDKKRDRYDVYVPTQGITMMRPGLSGALGITEDQVKVHTFDVGGGFGVRSEAYAEYPVVMMAAKMIDRPVKWVSTRQETMMSDHHARAAKLYGELALSKDGKMLGLRVEWIVDCGGYLSGAGPFINTAGPSRHPTNVYTIPAFYGVHRLVLTNTTPTTAYRGAARPNVVYLIERLVDEAAREMGIDRVQLRKKNLIPKKAFPYTIPTGAQYDSGDPAGLLAEVLEQADWKGFARRRKASEKQGKLRGISLCTFIEPSGGGVLPEDGMIRFGEAGNPVLYTVSGPSGQGHETVYPEVVAKVFGIDPELITYRHGDPEMTQLKGSGTIGSRSMMNHGGVLVKTAHEVVRKGKELASRHLEAAEADIEFEGGQFRVRGTDMQVGLIELAKTYATKKGNPLDSSESMPVANSFPTGAHVCEVEIDPATGEVDIVSYIGVDDAGNIINHMLAEGQVIGGLMQGLGQVMGEHYVYDQSSGQIVSGTFMDYYMPRADNQPPLKFFDRPVPSPTNPLGAKGVGEAGATGAVPTIANAVIDALRPLGINELDLPYSAHNVWKAIQAKKASKVM
ncbi:MAG: xanthine dehydrogenase family protein molybdopterin-binding subunit [Beijerinckiaceae bacterium]